MKKVLLTIGACMLFVTLGFGQTTILSQSFEDNPSSDWGFTTSPATYNTSGDVWAAEASPFNGISSTNGDSLWAMQDLENANGGGAFDHTLTFDTVDVSGLTNVELSFDWQTIGFDGPDTFRYQVFVDSTGQGEIELDKNSSGTVTESIAGGSDHVYVIIYVRQNGGSDYAGVDNFKVTFSALKAEPTNHPTSFTATANGFSQIDLTWTDATGAVTPDGYLIKTSSVSLGSITDPTDGTAESDDTDISDGAGVLNITQGTQTASFTNLSSSTEYFFKIYSYTNSGASIDYKTDATIQSDNATTSTFDSDIIISQYIETGSGTDPKGIELWNVSGSTIDFSTSNLVVNRFSGGGSSSSTEATISTGTLAAGAVMVIGHDTLAAYMTVNHPTVLFVDDPFTFNGDDALSITLGGALQDIFGQNKGTDPGSSWSENGVSTANSNIELKSGITEGSSTGFTDPSTRFQTVDNSIANTGDLRGFGVAPGGVLISGTAGWRLLSIPKTGATGADISDDGIGAQFTSNTDSATIYTYDNSGVYEAVSSSATTLTDGYGLAVYFFNNTQNGSSELPLILDVTGSEPSSDVSVTLNKSNTAGTVGTGGTGLANSYYTLVGNPFTSNYNLNSITVTGGAIQNNVQFWNDGSSTYSQLDRTAPSTIAPWQGFWVEVLNANAATGITFPTSGRSTSVTSGTFFSKQNPNKADIAFTLSSESTFDEAIKLSFRDYAAFGMDVADASKLVPFTLKHATMAFVGEYQGETILKSVESLPFNLTEEVTLSLQPQFVGVDGVFTFAWKGIESIPSGWEMTLHDYETGINVDMKTESEYIFNAVSNVASKVNPRSIFDGPAAKPMKAKSSSANRFGLTIVPGTSVSNETGSQPAHFALEQNYPNPFNPNTTIKYSLEEAGLVSLTVYNIVGQKVAELVNEVKPSGVHTINWNASSVASGMYYYRLVSGNEVQTRKMTLIK